MDRHEILKLDLPALRGRYISALAQLERAKSQREYFHYELRQAQEQNKQKDWEISCLKAQVEELESQLNPPWIM